MTDINYPATQKWHLITVDDPAFLSGKTIADLIELIKTIIPFKYIILDDLYGAGRHGLSYTYLEQDEVYEVDEFVKNLCVSNSFEWGNFFLFINYPGNWNYGERELYPFLIKQTNTTVRAIDNQYIYIYTPYQEIVDALKMKYTIESHKIDFLENLDYPE